MEKVTREVIADLWPLYAAGEASPDSRALIEWFLRSDPEFAGTLADASRPPLAVPELQPDHELKTLTRIRKRLAGPVMFLQLALVFTCFSFGALISDTSFDVSPRRFIVTASLAAGFWTVFLIRLYRSRTQILLR